MDTNDLTIVKPAKTSLALRSLKTGETFSLEGEMLVGREVECAIILNSQQISRYHAKILVSANKVFIEDLHSSNGTYVNGKRIGSRTHLALGDEVTFDEEAYRVTSDRSGAAAVTQLATPKMRAAIVHEPPPRPAQNDAVADPPPIYAEPPPEQASIDPPPIYAEPGMRVSAELNADDARPDVAAPLQDNAQINNTKMLTPDRRAQIEAINQQFQRDVNLGSGPRLVVMTAPVRGQIFLLSSRNAGTEWRIGRAKDADIYIQEKSVSRDHARVVKTDTGYQIIATQAANGILVNGKSESDSVLCHDDKIQMGRMTLVFKTDIPDTRFEDEEKMKIVERQRFNRSMTIIGFVTFIALIILLVSL